jgi:SOS-response transcriptional repressor LexA
MTYSLVFMERKPLSKADKLAADRLRAIWDSKKKKLGLTQEIAAQRLHFETQGAVSHYLRGYTPLNTDATVKFANLLEVPPTDIRPNFDVMLTGVLASKEDPSATIQSDLINIPKLSVRASAGNGVMQMEVEYQVGTIQVPEFWLRKNITCTSFKNLRTITVFGDSMFDTLHDGDLVFVDVGVREIDRDGIYVVTLDGELFIKTFERRPTEGVVWMRSDNRKKYPDHHVITKDRLPALQVLARGVYAWNGKKL